MDQKTKWLLGLGAVLVIVLFLLVIKDKEKNNPVAYPQNNSGLQTTPVQKTSNVEAVVSGIIDDLEADAAFAAENDADVEYVDQSTALMNSSEVYNENDF